MRLLPACHDKGSIARPVEPASEGLGRVVDDLFEVVEDDQAAAATRDRMAELRTWIVLAQRYVERGGHGEVDAVARPGFGQVAEVDAARPVAEPCARVSTHQAGLARPARADDRDQSGTGLEATAERAQFRRASDERVALGHEVVAHFAHRLPERTRTRDAICLVAVGRRK